jgi:peptidoglycan/xylan/chitin deacetylase (PgdA/CDA1 family)
VTRAALVLLVVAALAQAVVVTADTTRGPARDPMAEARARAHGLLVPGSQAWVYAHRKAIEQREARTPALGPHKPSQQPARRSYLMLRRGSSTHRTIALTFDDGPHPEFTPKLLAVLSRYHVQATFFVVGKMAQKYPHLVRQEMAAGHEIGNHTFHHVNVALLSESDAAAEWKAGEEAITAITGERVRYCRPPGGRYDRSSVIASSRLGLTTVLWTDNSGDYLGMGPRQLERRVLSRASNGGIILMHDGVQQTIDVLPQIIEKLRGRGYRFVTLAEMEDRRGPE